MISHEKLFEVAVSYYVKKKLQREIAEELGVSHVQVSKYLKQAEERGIVSITINPPHVSQGDQRWYQVMFKEMFGLENLILTPGVSNTDKTHNILIEYAAKYITDHYPNTKMNIGLGWGKTIFDIAQVNSIQLKKSFWNYYPVCVPRQIREQDFYDYRQITSSFVKNWGGTIDPSVIEFFRLYTSSEELARQIEKIWASLDIMIFGIGISFTRLPTSREQLFSDSVATEVGNKDLVGDMVNHYFDIEGNIFSPKNEISQIPLEIFKKLPNTIAIATGLRKVVSIIGALRTGLVGTLITDIETAKHVVEYLK